MPSSTLTIVDAFNAAKEFTKRFVAGGIIGASEFAAPTFVKMADLNRKGHAFAGTLGTSLHGVLHVPSFTRSGRPDGLLTRGRLAGLAFARHTAHMKYESDLDHATVGATPLRYFMSTHANARPLFEQEMADRYRPLTTRDGARQAVLDDIARAERAAWNTYHRSTANWFANVLFLGIPILAATGTRRKELKILAAQKSERGFLGLFQSPMDRAINAKMSWAHSQINSQTAAFNLGHKADELAIEAAISPHRNARDRQLAALKAQGKSAKWNSLAHTQDELRESVANFAKSPPVGKAAQAFAAAATLSCAAVAVLSAATAGFVYKGARAACKI